MKGEHLHGIAVALEAGLGLPSLSANFQASGWIWFEIPFRCADCSHCAVAIVWGWGAGVGASPLGLRDAEAHQAAHRACVFIARANAAESLSLAPCPACGARSRDACALLDRTRRRAIRNTLLIASLAMLPFALLAWVEPAILAVAAVTVALGCFFLISRANDARRNALARGLSHVTFSHAPQ